MLKKRIFITGISVIGIIAILLLFVFVIKGNSNNDDKNERHLQYLEKNMQDEILSLGHIESAKIDLQYDGSRYIAKINLIMQENQILSDSETGEIKKFVKMVLADISDEDIIIYAADNTETQ